jgi:hypothetical protein
MSGHAAELTLSSCSACTSHTSSSLHSRHHLRHHCRVHHHRVHHRWDTIFVSLHPSLMFRRLTHHSWHAHSTHVWPCAHGTGVTAHAARSATDRSTLVTAARVSAPATRVSASTSWDETASSTAASATVYVSTACWATRCARRAVGFAVLAVRLCMTS